MQGDLVSDPGVLILSRLDHFVVARFSAQRTKVDKIERVA
jgi:hypothetical protein